MSEVIGHRQQGVEGLVPKFGPRRFFRCLVSPPAISKMSCVAPGDFSVFWFTFASSSDCPVPYMAPRDSENRRGPKNGTRHDRERSFDNLRSRLKNSATQTLSKLMKLANGVMFLNFQKEHLNEVKNVI